ncbi:MAG: GMC family oxidoreductase, partial [Anaerolineae bacterium]|nr:GMC family oxidoreductase [Anaerolineae bacterium]
MPFNNFLDARKIPSDTEYEADVCIIGSGPAGITLAKELLGTTASLILLEAGGLSIDPSVDQLSQIVDAGREYHPEGKRLRYFGGTANHWGGHC